MFLNEARFAPNGRCGYILKPEFLRESGLSPGSAPGSGAEAAAKPQQGMRLKIQIISGQHLPKPGQKREGEIVDPYVEVEVYGHPTDSQKQKTKFIKNNGFNPVWEEVLEFVVNFPKLAFLYFVVKDQENFGTDEELAQYMILLTSVNEGYRHVHLLDENGQRLVSSSLFIHVTIEPFDTLEGSVPFNEEKSHELRQNREKTGDNIESKKTQEPS